MWWRATTIFLSLISMCVLHSFEYIASIFLFSHLFTFSPSDRGLGAHIAFTLTKNVNNNNNYLPRNRSINNFSPRFFSYSLYLKEMLSWTYTLQQIFSSWSLVENWFLEIAYWCVKPILGYMIGTVVIASMLEVQNWKCWWNEHDHWIFS